MTAARAASAFQKTIAARPSLPFEAAGASRPAEADRQRLKGAYLISLDRIQPDPTQPRRAFDAQDLADLTASVAARGIRQPIRVRYVAEQNVYCIISGERRYRAAVAAKLTVVPCIVDEAPPTLAGVDGQEILVEQIVENWQRANLQPMETANALARLRDESGLSLQAIGERIGKPKAEVSKYLSMHDWVQPEVKQMATSEDGAAPALTGRHLYNLSKLKPAEQQPLAERIRREQLTALETERIVREKLSPTLGGKTADRGLSARRRQFKTAHADVVMTFRKAKPTDDDVRAVIEELRRRLDLERGH